MAIRTDLKSLTEMDTWSLMLFILFNFQHDPAYASISELAYILDKKNMLKLCEYFGGSTIKIPTIDELEDVLYAMLIYEHIEKHDCSMTRAINDLQLTDKVKEKSIEPYYKTLVKTLSEYSISTRNRI